MVLLFLSGPKKTPLIALVRILQIFTCGKSCVSAVVYTSCRRKLCFTISSKSHRFTLTLIHDKIIAFSNLKFLNPCFPSYRKIQKQTKKKYLIFYNYVASFLLVTQSETYYFSSSSCPTSCRIMSLNGPDKKETGDRANVKVNATFSPALNIEKCYCWVFYVLKFIVVPLLWKVCFHCLPFSVAVEKILPLLLPEQNPLFFHIKILSWIVLSCLALKFSSWKFDTVKPSSNLEWNYFKIHDSIYFHSTLVFITLVLNFFTHLSP